MQMLACHLCMQANATACALLLSSIGNASMALCTSVLWHYLWLLALLLSGVVHDQLPGQIADKGGPVGAGGGGGGGAWASTTKAQRQQNQIDLIEDKPASKEPSKEPAQRPIDLSGSEMKEELIKQGAAINNLTGTAKEKATTDILNIFR